MIAAVKGIVEAKSLDSAYVSVGGVTLRVYAPLSTLSSLTVGQTAHLHTHLLVREDVLALYGFASLGDREVFEQLLAVGGVGPRIGVALLSTMSAAGLRDAILAEDLARLSLAPGVGRKLAARLVLELRPRFERMAPTDGAPMIASGGAGSRAAVVDALTSLGYPPTEAAAAARSLPEDATGTLEDLIMRALRSLARE
jgi:holliday junction DNA helicase RuvA